MKKILPIVLIVIFGGLIYLNAHISIEKTRKFAEEKNIEVFMVYNSSNVKGSAQIFSAYESVLAEEGIPYKSIDVFTLIRIKVDTIIKRVPALILPDGILQTVPSQFVEWTKEYLTKGGNVAIVYDVGTRHRKGYFLNKGVFSELMGLNYITYNKYGKKAFTNGHIWFTSNANRIFFQFPLGKTLDRLSISSYYYGKLQYPMTRNEQLNKISESDIYAYGITSNHEKIPLILLTNYAKGKVLYVNLPLGYLKSNTDDLPLRSIIRTFLFDVVEIPHVMNVAYGRGGIIINWHIDSNAEHPNLPRMLNEGFFRKGMSASFHITAGPFRDKPGDGFGFDADGKGRTLVKTLNKYGVIGSHGGWAHNWFSEKVNNGEFGEKEIREYITKNNESLRRITGYKITEYSAPNGVHPQPITTQILEELGVVAYYYTGDSGSSPNRTFYEGRMVSDKVIAFPVMPFGRAASLYEMKKFGKKEENEVEEWFSSILDYVANNRTVRLLYSHPYDINNYPLAVKAFINKAEKMQSENRISTFSMTDYARFFLRFLKSKYSFKIEGQKLTIFLENPDNLEGITVALPKKNYQIPSEYNNAFQEDEKYYYLTVGRPNEKTKKFMVNIR